MVEPLEFINTLRNSDDYIKIIYLNGGCYNLFKILKLLYPNAIAYKVKVTDYDDFYSHIVTRIGENYYDINGIVNTEYYDRRKVDKNDLNEIANWRFSKTRRLFKLCENCFEEVYFWFAIQKFY